MCECGCVTNHKRYKFPAPGRALYVLELAGHCLNCDAPAGVSIELIEPNNVLYREMKAGDFVDGDLPFEQWPDSKGVAIICGMDRSDFIKALMSHLVGVNSAELGEGGVLDEAGADVILEEMYEDAQTTPHLLADVNEFVR